MPQDRYIDLLRLTFLLLPREASGMDGQLVLNAIKKAMPMAEPQKMIQVFYESKLSLEHDLEEQFISTWNKTALDSSDGNPGFYWGLTSPGLKGMVRMGGAWPKQTFLPLSPDEITIDFNFSLLREDAAITCAEIVTGFTELAIKLNAFFASGFVLEKYLLEDGEPVFEVDVTERLPTFSDWWSDVPMKAWLTWFGSEYAGLLGAALSDCSCATNYPGKGYLLKLSESPVNSKLAKKTFPELPKSALSSLGFTRSVARLRQD